LDAANTFTKSQTVNGTMTATSFSGSGSGLTNVNAAELGGVASSAFAQLSASSNTFTGGVTAASFTGSGSGLTSVNASQLGGLSSSTFAQLAAANTFTGNQMVNGNLSATGVVTGSSYQIGSNLFAFGSYANNNAFLGFAGNSVMVGSQNTATGDGALSSNVGDSAGDGWLNTAVGYSALTFNNNTGGTGNYATLNTAIGGAALFFNTTGAANTATGFNALVLNTTGADNTASGASAGFPVDSSNITGSNNTFVGADSGPSTGTLSNATAIGAGAVVGESNALVLGSINGMNGATASTFVGIGTTTPQTALDVLGNSTVHTLIGSGGCGPDYAGIGFVANGGFNPNCANYALLGENNGNLYINSVESGEIYFRNNNGANLMTIDTAGDVSIKGTLSKGSGSFKIDHPLDPAHKYLYHSFVESPDMMDVYNGNITTNQRGLAVVVLPEYFEALNRDFRYQLTVLGQFAQAIVARKIAHNQFVIRTNKPGVEVSWQVTGIRQDAYANAHRIPTEEEKPPQEQGTYLHPELFGAQTARIGYEPAMKLGPTEANSTPTAGTSEGFIGYAMKDVDHSR
jgi:trimeric autotransporter adhesin